MDDSDTDSFDGFFRKHVVSLLQHLTRQGFGDECAKEAVSETMASLYERWGEIRYPLRWARRTAWCHALDEVKIGHVPLAEHLERDGAGPCHLDEDPVVQQESKARVVHLLDGMPVRRRAVISGWLDGFDDQEIAEELKISEATVRSHRRHGLREVAAKLGREGGRP